MKGNVVTYKKYEEEKKDFLFRHGGMYKVDTSDMDDCGVYYKTYIAEDGKVWYERMSPEVVKGGLDVYGVLHNVLVKMLKTEFWSSDDGVSRCYYEVFNHNKVF